MSLPSTLIVKDSNEQQVARGFINVGWIIYPDILATEIINTIQKIYTTSENNDYYSKVDKWIEKAETVVTYGISVPFNLIKKTILEKSLQDLETFLESEIKLKTT